MATKDYSSFLKTKKDKVDGNFSSNGKYSNLNLNEHHSTVLLPANSKSISFESGKVSSNDFVDRKSLNAKEKSVFWSKTNKNSSFTFSNLDKDEKELQKEKRNNSKISTTKSSSNSSTLSLHIAAYENFIEASEDSFDDEIFDGNKSNKMVKNWKNLKQTFVGLNLIDQNPFEFPRQQEEDLMESAEPEIAQFKASQKLFTPSSVASPSVSLSKIKFICDQQGNCIIADSREQKEMLKLERNESYMSVDLDQKVPLEPIEFEHNGCEKCHEFADRISALEEKLHEVEEMSDSQNDICVRLVGKLEEEKKHYEEVVEECQHLHHELDAYSTRSGKEISENLPAFAEARIYELSSEVQHLKNQKLDLQGRCIDYENGIDEQLNRSQALIDEYNSMKDVAEQAQDEHEDLKEQFLAAMEKQNSGIREKSDEIQKLQKTLSTSAQLFEQILGASDFENDEMKKEIEQFLNAHCNVKK